MSRWVRKGQIHPIAWPCAAWAVPHHSSGHQGGRGAASPPRSRSSAPLRSHHPSTPLTSHIGISTLQPHKLLYLDILASKTHSPPSHGSTRELGSVRPAPSCSRLPNASLLKGADSPHCVLLLLIQIWTHLLGEMHWIGQAAETHRTQGHSTARPLHDFLCPHPIRWPRHLHPSQCFLPPEQERSSPVCACGVSSSFMQFHRLLMNNDGRIILPIISRLPKVRNA